MQWAGLPLALRWHTGPPRAVHHMRCVLRADTLHVPEELWLCAGFAESRVLVAPLSSFGVFAVSPHELAEPWLICGSIIQANKISVMFHRWGVPENLGAYVEQRKLRRFDAVLPKTGTPLSILKSWSVCSILFLKCLLSPVTVRASKWKTVLEMPDGPTS